MIKAQVDRAFRHSYDIGLLCGERSVVSREHLSAFINVIPRLFWKEDHLTDEAITICLDHIWERVPHLHPDGLSQIRGCLDECVETPKAIQKSMNDLEKS